MRVRVVGAIVLLLLLAGLVPLAYASPPDETWLPGVYDNADYDDVVIALTSAAGASDATPTPDLAPTAEIVHTLRAAEPSAPESAPRSPYRLRAPPLA
jgi:hypothetical protein